MTGARGPSDHGVSKGAEVIWRACVSNPAPSAASANLQVSTGKRRRDQMTGAGGDRFRCGQVPVCLQSGDSDGHDVAGFCRQDSVGHPAGLRQQSRAERSPSGAKAGPDDRSGW